MAVTAKRIGMLLTVLMFPMLMGAGCGTTAAIDTTNAWLLKDLTNTGATPAVLIIENSALTKMGSQGDAEASFLIADGKEHAVEGGATYTLSAPIIQTATMFRMELTLTVKDSTGTKTVTATYEGTFDTAGKKVTGTVTTVSSADPTKPETYQFSLEKM